jgi:hypothetical protein
MNFIAFLLQLLQTLFGRSVSGHQPDPDDDAIPVGPADQPPAEETADTPAPPPETVAADPITAPYPRAPTPALGFAPVPLSAPPAVDARWSLVARQVKGARNPKDARPRTPWGLLLHTTGGGVTRKAKKTGRSPVSVAIDVYLSSQNGSGGYLWGGPAYVLDHDGQLYQLAPDNVVTHHAGGPDRKHYLSGEWIKRCAKKAVDAWKSKWSSYSSPAALYPSASPNTDYIGVEMIPCGDGFGVPASPGCRFTAAQLAAVVALGRELAARHGWPPGWASTPRLLGHEDVQPLRRHTLTGCWDPGYLRPGVAYFPFDKVRADIAAPNASSQTSATGQTDPRGMAPHRPV